MKYIYTVTLVLILSGCYNKEVEPTKIDLIKHNEIVIDIEKDDSLVIKDNEIIIPEFNR